MSDGPPNDKELAELARATGAALQRAGLSVATAESCTGGWVAKCLTDIAGSSGWVECALVTYSNRSKQSLLGVAAQTLSACGAVSEATVSEMARGVLAATAADVSVAVSGIAGPGGGSAEKPVGSVWMAWARRDGRLHTASYYFAGDRDAVRRQGVAAGLRGLLALLDDER